jgi:hypothetical protein
MSAQGDARTSERVKPDHSRKLTFEQIALIRRTNEPDSYYVKLFGVAYQTIRHARIGRTHRKHPVPAQTQKRPPGRYRTWAKLSPEKAL